MILLLGEGGSLSFNNNSTGDYAKKWTIDNSIFSLRTFLYPTETRLRPLGCLSSHACISQNGFPPEAMQTSLTVHHGMKALQEMKEPNTVRSGCHRWFAWHIYIGKHPPGVQLCPRSMCCCSCSLLGPRDSWLNAGLIAIKYKQTASAWRKGVRSL